MNDQEQDTVCVEAAGLALEIGIAPGATSLDAGLCEVIAAAIVAANPVAGPVAGEVTVIVDDDGRIRDLNRQWRQIDKATNVLSFPYSDTGPGAVRYIGDIAISFETAAREAADEGKTLRDHVAHLSVHGFLHLLGYDHEVDEDAEAMEQLERTILAGIGIADPYVAPRARD